MLLRGMHDHGCDQVYVIVTDLDRSEMDEVTEYFKLASRANGKTLKLSLERRIRRERMFSLCIIVSKMPSLRQLGDFPIFCVDTRISHLLSAKGRHPCLPVENQVLELFDELPCPRVVCFALTDRVIPTRPVLDSLTDGKFSCQELGGKFVNVKGRFQAVEEWRRCAEVVLEHRVAFPDECLSGLGN